MSFFGFRPAQLTHRAHRKSVRDRIDSGKPDRSLRLEQLEQRYVLSGWLQVTLITTDMSGNPITSIAPGEEFELQAKVSDERIYPDGFESFYPPTAPTGTFASYNDVTFDPSLVAVDGDISYGSLFTQHPTPEDDVLATPGLLDEIGAAADFSTFFTGTPSPSLLFTVPFQANAAGVVNFVLDPADSVPLHDSLLFGLNSAVPLDKLDFVNCSIQVGSPNTPPIANPDAITVNAASSVTFDALADNGFGPDTDPDGDPLTIAEFTQPSSGTLTQNLDGTFTYTPASGFAGTDSFSYTIEDGKGGSASATVTLTVLSAQDQILLLTEQVNELVTSGDLNDGEANALTSKLDNAIRSLNDGNTTAGVNQMAAIVDSGQSGRTGQGNAGVNQLGAFINQVNALLKSGRLSDAQAQSLILAANQAIASALG